MKASDSSTSLSSQEAGELLATARKARDLAYAPYSGFGVGAALLDRGGRIHTGVNVENASFGLTLCAERSAVARAVAQGARDFRAVAIAGPEGAGACLPCGACRQVLHEFAPEILVVVEQSDRSVEVIPLAALLPRPFELRVGFPGRRADG